MLTLVPDSCYSTIGGFQELVQHSQALLLIFRAQHPEVIFVLHDVGQNRAPQEHHVLTSWRVFNPNLEFLQTHTHTREWLNNAAVAFVLHISSVRNSYRMSPIVPSLLQFSPTQTRVGHLIVRHTFIVQLHETHAVYEFIYINFLILLKASHQPVTTKTLKQFLSLKKHKGEQANPPKRLSQKYSGPNPKHQILACSWKQHSTKMR